MKFEEKVKQWVEGLTTDDQLRGVIASSAANASPRPTPTASSRSFKCHAAAHHTSTPASFPSQHDESPSANLGTEASSARHRSRG